MSKETLEELKAIVDNAPVLDEMDKFNNERLDESLAVPRMNCYVARPRIKLTVRQEVVLKEVEKGLLIPFKYKNEKGKVCFIDTSKEPSLLGNLYFTITVRSLFSKGLLCDSSIETQCKAKCLINGIKAIRVLNGFKSQLTPLGIEILKGDL